MESETESTMDVAILAHPESEDRINARQTAMFLICLASHWIMRTDGLIFQAPANCRAARRRRRAQPDLRQLRTR